MARCPVCSHITPVPAGGEVSPPPETAPAAASLESPPAWRMRTPEGQEFGPVLRADLDRWVAEGRVSNDCQLRSGENGDWESAGELFPHLKPLAPVPVWTPPTPLPVPIPTTLAGPYYGVPAAAGSFAPAAPSYQTPHRGSLILLLGLMGIFLQPCPVFAVIAWVMGSNDLREMEAGRMDRSGMDLTRAGMIMGMIISVLWILGFLVIGGLFFLAALAG